MHGSSVATVDQRCDHCGRTNRLLTTRLREAPVCGSCKHAVFPNRPVDVTDATWVEQVERSAIPVLADFWAPWCGPCRVMGPVLDQIAAARAGTLKVVKVNVDQNPGSAGRFGVQAVPTLVVLRAGTVVDQVRGAVTRAELEARLNRLT